MKYYKSKGQEFLENGRSTLHVTTMDTKPSPTSTGRVMKLLVVNEVVSTSQTNPIRQGVVLALSFPPEKLNAAAYEWGRFGPEETQVPLKIGLSPAT
jgi:hypothetical protein